MGDGDGADAVAAPHGAGGGPAIPRRGEPSGAERGLGVLPGRPSRGRVAYVPHSQVAVEDRQGFVVEHLGDQAHILVNEDRAPVGDGDSGGLLAAMLERVEPVVGELGDRLARREYAEHAAFVLRLLPGEEIACQPPVSLHPPMVSQYGPRRAFAVRDPDSGCARPDRPLRRAGLRERARTRPSTWRGRLAGGRP